MLRVDVKDRKIGLSMRNVDSPEVPPDAITDIPTEATPAGKPVEGKADKDKGKPEPKRDLRGGTGTAGPLFQLPGDENKG